MNSLQLDFPKMTCGSGDMRDPLGKTYAGSVPVPPGQGHRTDWQGLALVFACHVLDPHGQVAHRALATAEIEAVWVHEEQVPGKGGIGGTEDPLEGWGQPWERRSCECECETGWAVTPGDMNCHR